MHNSQIENYIFSCASRTDLVGPRFTLPRPLLTFTPLTCVGF